jgi:HAMP domain-containing protein
LRLLGIYFSTDLLLTLLFAGGVVVWSERQCGDIAALVEERGVPSAEATLWMAAGDYTVTAGEGEPAGVRLPYWLPWPAATGGGERYLDPGEIHLFSLLAIYSGGTTSYTLQLPNGAEPYAITLDLEHPVTLGVFGLRILMICQLVSLLSNLFKNAGTIKKTLRPIQELAAAAAKLNTASGMSPEELSVLADKLDEINATHLDTRISVSGTQKELRELAQAINAMLDRINGPIALRCASSPTPPTSCAPHRRGPGLRQPAGPLGQGRPGHPAGGHRRHPAGGRLHEGAGGAASVPGPGGQRLHAYRDGGL